MIWSKGEWGPLQYFAEAQINPYLLSLSLLTDVVSPKWDDHLVTEKKHRPLNSCNVCAEASPNPFHTLQVTPAAADPLQNVYCLGPHCFV